MKNSSISSLFGMAVSGLSRLAIFIIIGRSLGAEALASVSGVLSVAVVIGLIWPTSAGIVYGMFVRNANVARERQETISLWLYRSVFLFACFTFLVVWLASSFTKISVFAIFLASAVTAIYGVYTFLRPVLITNRQNKKYVIAETVSSVVSVLFAFVFGFSMGLPGYLIAFLIMFGGFVVLARQFQLNKFNWSFSPPYGIAKVSGHVISTQLLTNVSVQLVLLAVLWQGTSQEAGYMAQAFSLATPVAMIGFAIAQSAIPHLAKQQNRALFNIEFSKILKISLPAIFVLYFCVFMFGNLAVSIVFNPDWIDPAVMPMLACGLLLYTVGLVLSAAVNSLHLPKRNTASYIAGLATGGFSFLVLDSIDFAPVIIVAPVAFIIFTLVTLIGLVVSLRERK